MFCVMEFLSNNMIKFKPNPGNMTIEIGCQGFQFICIENEKNLSYSLKKSKLKRKIYQGKMKSR